MATPLARALKARGYEKLTPVQQAMLPAEVEGADLLVSAQTGSGKTVAFGIAIAAQLLGAAERFEADDSPVALIIAPTRELAMQVKRELEWLYAEAGARLAACVGGMDMRAERRVLERNPHIVVGTPGRLRDHITRGSLDLSALRAVVLDEADEMLDLGFRDDLEFILAAAPAERRTLMFSATVPKQIAQLAARFQRDALRISATSEATQHSDIDYRQMLVPPADRENAIINTLLFYDSQSAIVFCHTRESVKHLASRLSNRGFAVVALSGELSQAERNNALQSMRDGRARVCVATDVAARGIDLPNLDLVIHADIPSNPDTLKHRSGRTGRAGRKGVCVLVAPFHRRGAVARVLKLAKLEAQLTPAPTIVAIEQQNRERILNDPSLAELVAEGDAPFLKELIDKHGAEALAAAYLRTQLAARPAPEELMDAPVFPDREKRGDRKEREFSDRPPRDHRDGPHERSDFADGVWFRVSVGRKHRAEPRWLLPMICKAGHVDRKAVGSIRIFDADTQFEISGERADAFLAAVKENGTGEKGVTIQRIDGPRDREPASERGVGRGEARQAKPEFRKPRDGKPPFKAGKPGQKGKPFAKSSKPPHKKAKRAE